MIKTTLGSGMPGSKVWISMAGPASPHENAIEGRVNGILKEEWFLDAASKNNIDPRKYIGQVIHIYNTTE